MRRTIVLFGAMIALVAMLITQSIDAVAQATGSEQDPTQVTKALPQTPSAKDLEGKDAFTSDGQQVGKVTKAITLPDGNVKDIEIQSSGFLGFFSKTYVVSVDKAAVNGGRVALSITGDQIKQLVK